MPRASEPRTDPIVCTPLILIVERNVTVRKLLIQTVKDLGYRARACPTASAALLFLLLHPRGVQCLLADWAVRDLPGGELIDRARDVEPRLRVAVMTTPGHPGAEDLLAAYPDVPCLVKPVPHERLAATLGRLLGPPQGSPEDPRSRRRPRRRRRPSGQHQG